MENDLLPADRAEVVTALSIGLRLARRNATVNDFMATVTADFVVDRLERCNYVLMRKPPAPWHSTPGPEAINPRIND